MRKVASFTLLLILAVSSTLWIEYGSAQSIPTPSVPEFTVKYVDSSYYVAPVYGVDQYSGNTVQTGGGFTVNNKTLEITIMSQSFTPYVFTGDDGLPHSPYMRWDIAYKGHFGEDWRISNQNPNWNESSKVIALGLGMENSDHYISGPHTDIPASLGDQIDFKIRARIGYDSLKEGLSPMDPNAFTFHGETSGWSNIQTITIGGATNSNTPNPTSPTTTTPPATTPTLTITSTPTASDTNPSSINTLIVIIVVLAITTVALSILLIRRHRITPMPNQ